MTLRSRLGLVSLRSRLEMDVATWLDWWQRFGVATNVFGSRQGRYVGETETGHDLILRSRLG